MPNMAHYFFQSFQRTYWAIEEIVFKIYGWLGWWTNISMKEHVWAEKSTTLKSIKNCFSNTSQKKAIKDNFVVNIVINYRKEDYLFVGKDQTQELTL